MTQRNSPLPSTEQARGHSVTTVGKWTAAIAAEVLYRIGCALSWLDHRLFGHLYFERGRFVINCSLYPIYNRLFVWSADLSEPR